MDDDLFDRMTRPARTRVPVGILDPILGALP
jgi:hypothetical protein